MDFFLDRLTSNEENIELSYQILEILSRVPPSNRTQGFSQVSPNTLFQMYNIVPFQNRAEMIHNKSLKVYTPQHFIIT